MRWSVPLAAMLLAACSSGEETAPDSGPGGPDQAGDRLPLADDSSPVATDAAVADCCGGEGRPGDLAHQPDAALWDAGGRPYGQCVTSSDCYWGLPCALEQPGGLCASCTLPDDCGDAMTYDCVDGLCQRLCLQDGHCPLGQSCSSSHLCEPLACGPGQPPCPAPYVCGESQTCRRPPCAASPPLCPTGMICGEGRLCMENYE